MWLSFGSLWFLFVGFVHLSFMVIVVFLFHYCFYLRNVCLKELFCRFVKVEKIRDQLLECNKQTYWVPDYVKVLYLFLSVTQSN